MNPLQRLVSAAMVVALAAAFLFMPRHVPLAGTKYPFLFGDSLLLKLSVDTQQLAIEVGAIVIVGGALWLITGRMR